MPPVRHRDASGRWTVFVRDERLVGLIRQLPVRSKAEVDRAAQDIRERASQLAPRDTGSLAESLYVNNTSGDSDYSQRASAARSRNREAIIGAEVTPEFALSLFGSAGNSYVSVVGAAVGHALFQEFGTVHQGAQAFLTPAVEANRDEFQQAMSHVADT